MVSLRPKKRPFAAARFELRRRKCREGFRYIETKEVAMAAERPSNSSKSGIEDPTLLSPGLAFPFRWPQRLLGPRPGLREITIVCWGLFLGLLVIPLCFVLRTRLRQGAGCDFVYFYGVGHIFRNYPSASLFDLDLQLRTFNAIAPPPVGFYGPSPYPLSSPNSLACLHNFLSNQRFSSGWGLRWRFTSGASRSSSRKLPLRKVSRDLWPFVPRWLFVHSY